MEPKAFLDLAERLLKNTNCEASLRTCIGRSYYAFYNLVIQFLRPNFPNDFPRAAESHKKAFEYLSDCGIEDVELAASNLNDLRTERNQADYDLELGKFEENHANLIYLKAKFAMQTFEKTIKNADGRKALIKGIEFHKQKLN